jgi:hypothetical protein
MSTAPRAIELADARYIAALAPALHPDLVRVLTQRADPRVARAITELQILQTRKH